jgi:hypothetical protein
MSGFAYEPPVSNTVEWYTPPYIFNALGVRFDLDPCSPGPAKSFVPADTHYVLPENNGLSDPWFGRVWLNPPYGRGMDVWLSKLAAHGDGIALVFARTSTRWFHQYVPKSSGVLFVKGRVRYVNGSTMTIGDNPGTDSMLVAFGNECGEALRASGLGLFVRPE